MSAGFVVADEPPPVASGVLLPPFEHATAITRTTDAAATLTRTRRFMAFPLRRSDGRRDGNRGDFPLDARPRDRIRKVGRLSTVDYRGPDG
jgi:hypothetical protein